VAARFVRPLAAAGLLVAVLGIQDRLLRRGATESGEIWVPRPEGARIAALGFDSLAADFYWLRVVQLVGAADGDFASLAPLIERITRVVVALDPWVSHPYRFAALWTSERADTLPGANRILERGIAYHPKDWRNRFYLSFNHFFQLGDTEAAARELERAVELPGAPPYLGRLRARLSSAGGDLEAAHAYLSTRLEQDPPEWHRVEYEKALEEIETERRARVLDAARARFQQETGRDIRRVEELAWGPHALLFTIPPEPHGFGWVIHPDSGQIVSGYYGRRYRLHFQDPGHPLRRAQPAADGGAG
jgi:hypothetical protein